jgi:hypothetical protein
MRLYRSSIFVVFAGLLLGCGGGETDYSRLRALKSDAASAYEKADYARSGELYAQALKEGSRDAVTAYNAACSYALAEDRTHALQYLNKALMMGYHDPAWMDQASDLDMLKDLPEWPGFLKRARENEVEYLSRINKELLTLFEADQTDRNRDWSTLPADSSRAIYERDRRRIERVKEIISDGQLVMPDDYFHAALILQHGKDSTEYKLAQQLAGKAVQLDPEQDGAAWLSAAAEDRYLWSISKPQVWGTQFTKPAEDAPWTQAPFDTTVKNDEERALRGVPPLEEQRRRLLRMNQ